MQYLFCLYLLAFQPIEYRELNWSDFKGRPERSGWAATTNTTLELTEEQWDGKYSFSTKAYFIPGESWTNVSDLPHLKHEQTHLDITYLYYLKSIRTLLPYQGTAKRKEAIRDYQKLCRQWQSTERLFDIRTNHSQDTSQEQIWERSIQKQIKKLE